MAIIATSDDKDLHSRWSEHAVHNAFCDIVLADPVRGIFSATPVEKKHAFCKELIKHVTFLVLDNVPTSRKAALVVKSTVLKIFASSSSESCCHASHSQEHERLSSYLFQIHSFYPRGQASKSEVLANAIFGL